MTRAKLPEIDRVTCKKCGHKKLRIAAGKYDKRNKRYVDNHGSHWNGRLCPTCHNKRIKENMQTMRLSRKVQAFDDRSKQLEMYIEEVNQINEND